MTNLVVGGATGVKDVAAHSKIQLIWYCPSRWLLAHHDIKAGIQTLSSHMCLADLNNDGEHLLALIDFKQQTLGADDKNFHKTPYECRIRVYRGQQLIYNHFLDDMPTCLLATSVTALSTLSTERPISESSSQTASNIGSQPNQEQHQTLLTVAIMDDVYFYNRLKPSHKISLEDEESILDLLVKSEVDVWQMVKQNKADEETMRELLYSLSQEMGNHELTCHSLNFLALDSSEARKQYLTAWKLERLHEGRGEHIMSMDIICCAASRLKYSSSITQSGNFGQTRESGSFLNNSRWTRILDLQKDGLVLGTEDRHILIYELRPLKSKLEANHRLPSVPDHILVERRSPVNFDLRGNLKELTYKILVSCRNCRIYSLDQLYVVDDKSANTCKFEELVALKSNVTEMSWCGVDDVNSQDACGLATNPNAPTWPLFVVACLDKRVYCFNSQTGQCKWVVELELPITCLVCLPKIQVGPDDSSLVGVSSMANRIDFYVARSGRIVDSIYFSKDDYPVATTYGRFGREDNCLIIVSHQGHLLIFILKRTAKFAHGQCLSSAASYASDTLAKFGQVLQESLVDKDQQTVSEEKQRAIKLDKPVSVPSAFSLSKSTVAGGVDQVLESMMQLDHDCNQVAAKNALEAYVTRPQLQIPTKRREFVDQILVQSRRSRTIGRAFVNHMVKLRDKVVSTMGQQIEMNRSDTSTDGGNRVILVQVTGLGNIYRVSLSIRLNLEKLTSHVEQCIAHPVDTAQWTLIILICPSQSSQNMCRVEPFRLTCPVESDLNGPRGVKVIFEHSLDFKLYKIGSLFDMESSQNETVEVQVQVLGQRSSAREQVLLRKPLLITSINVPMS